MTEYYYIATGGGCKIYTLRLHWQECGHDGEVVERDNYVRNLAIDPDVAYAKAKSYVDAFSGTLKGEANIDLNDYKSRIDDYVWDGKTMCYGNKYYGDSIASIVEDEDGVQYLAEEYGYPTNPRQADVDCKALVDSLKEVKAYHKYHAKLEADRQKEIDMLSHSARKSEFIDQPLGSHLMLDVEILEVFAFEGHYGTSWCVKAVDDNNNRITAFSTAKWVRELQGGEKMMIKGVVSDFRARDEQVELLDGTFTMINDVKSTTIKRIKEVA